MIPLLEVVSISKAFAGVQALASVSFDVRAGGSARARRRERRGQVDADRIMTGAETPDSGLRACRRSVVIRIGSGICARAMGIAAIYQQPSLLPDLTGRREHRAVRSRPAACGAARERRRARVDRARDLARARRRLDRSCPARGHLSHLPEQQLGGDRPRDRRRRAAS